MGQSNSRDEIKTNKICIGDTCLSEASLRDILIATNNSIQLSSNAPYVKNENNEGSCNKGYEGKIMYTNDGLSGCNKCNRGTYKSSVSNGDCIKCPEGYYCPDNGLGIYDKNIICSKGFFCPKGSHEQKPCPEGETSEGGAKACFEQKTIAIIEEQKNKGDLIGV